MKQNGSFIEGPILSPLLRFTFPVLLGQKLGEGKSEAGGKVLGSAIALFTAVALVLTAAMLWAANPLARLMQVPAEAFGQTVVYVRICSGRAVFIVAYNVLGAMFRGLGDSKTPLPTVTIACVVNIAGDLLLVGPCGLGVGGGPGHRAGSGSERGAQSTVYQKAGVALRLLPAGYPL